MVPLKAKITDRILKLVNRFPYLFPSRLGRAARFHNSKSATRLRIEEDEGALTKASLLDERTIWRGVHVLVPVSNDEAKRVKKSFSKHTSPYALRRPPKKDTGYFYSAWRTLGVVDFKNELMFPAMQVALKSDAPSYCNVTLLTLTSGAMYLSMYVRLDVVVSSRITSVDVSFIKSYKEYDSFNPFAGFGTVILHDKRNAVHDYIAGAALGVTKDAIDAVLVMLRSWGVKKKPVELATVADFSRDSAHPYFSRDRELGLDHYQVVNPSRISLVSNPSNTANEEWLTYDAPAEIGVDAIFVHSEDYSITPRSDGYLMSEQGGQDKYAGMLYTLLLKKKLAACGDEVIESFSGSGYDSKKHLETLIRQGLTLTLIEEHIEALRKGEHWFDREYVELNRRDLNLLCIHAKGLRETIRARHDIANAEVQVSNLHWMKRYSLIMFLLVVMQVFLAVIAVDWSPTGLDKNSMYQNWKTITSWFGR
ncbi:hypothetical protein E2H86_11605 [Pseudomonas putida]|uniref:hypothetical protein n=1 Tax=Pseudomonas putida TaxID=303 RepID=UPI0010596276|nr:hypothetical protein [Pseudomonas putida]TDJ76418.1 hypothetical protein E2H86_11605 [Pseudomonas putida]